MSGLVAAVAGAAVVAVPAGAVLYRSVRGLRRAVREADRLAGRLEAARYEATHDGLTGVLNRCGFSDRAGALLACDGAGPAAVVLVDLNDFKALNDVHGHGVGDIALIAAAARLTTVVGPGGLVGRLGGDEFVALVPLPVVERLAEVTTVAVEVELDRVVRVSASVGVAPADGPADLAVLLGRADAAMYRAKQAGTGVAVFDPVTDDHTVPVPGGRPAVRTRDLPVSERQVSAVRAVA